MADANMGLEVIKVGSSVATPIIVLFLGIWAKNVAVDYDRRSSLNVRIIEKRVQIYEEIKIDINDIFVYLTKVGNWKELTPQEVIAKKRRLDKTMYTSRPYWSNVVFDAYSKFMAAAFKTYTGSGKDAKIRTNKSQFERLPNWETSFSDWFAENDATTSLELREKYSLLMQMLSSDFGYYQDIINTESLNRTQKSRWHFWSR